MKQKIVLSLLALFIFFTIGTLTAILYMTSNTSDLKEIIKLHEVEELRRSLVIKIQSVQSDLYTVDTLFIDDFDSIVANASDLNQTADKCTSCHHDPKLSERIEEVQLLIKDYELSLSYYLTASANTERITRLKSDAASIGKRLVTLTGAMSHSASLNLKEKTEMTMKRMNYVRTILFITIIITFIFGVLISVNLTKSVTKPISALLNATRMISSGKLGSTISYSDSTEFGELATHFNTMSTAVKEGYDHIQKEISERKQAEEALRESEEKFRTFFELSPVGILIYPAESKPFDRRLEFATFNSSFHKFFGYTREDLHHKTITDLTYPEDLDQNIKLNNELLEGKRDSYKMEKRYLHQNGEIIWGYLNVTTIKDARSNPSLVMTSLVDITESKKMEEEQMKIEKLESVGILAGGIAHDFNNILASIVINITRAKMSLDTGDKVSDILTDIEDGCRRAKDLTNKLITFSKGGTPIKKIIPIKEQIKDSTLFALKGSDVKCDFQISEDLWNVEIDEGQINQVIVNLVLNAVQAMPDGGKILIKAENIYNDNQKAYPLPDKEFVKISVQDEGEGIAKEHVKKIFDPYFTTKKGGSGLGLSSAYSIIKNHNGFIEVESDGKDGASFHIFLPAIKYDPVLHDKNKKARSVKGGKVLLMDDDDTVRETLGKTLHHLGYDMELARDGNEAIDLYKKARHSDKPFDVVIMDLKISSGMGGEDTIMELLKIDPAVKAIVSSGYSNEAIMANYKRYGFSGIISKPFEIEELNELLQQVMAHQDIRLKN